MVSSILVEETGLKAGFCGFHTRPEGGGKSLGIVHLHWEAWVS